jgi:hypothetical protein
MTVDVGGPLGIAIHRRESGEFRLLESFRERREPTCDRQTVTCDRPHPPTNAIDALEGCHRPGQGSVESVQQAKGTSLPLEVVPVPSISKYFDIDSKGIDKSDFKGRYEG